MIAVVGATGHTGKRVSADLLEAGAKVRVIGRTADKVQRFVAKGAEAFTGEVLDTNAMTRAFTGCAAVYLLVPPDQKHPNQLAHYAAVAESLATALEKSGATHAVLLSSVGAHLAQGAGPVSGLHGFEERLKRVANVNVLFLRAAYFMENFYTPVTVYRSMGFFSGLVKGDAMMPMIASRDIGQRAAKHLLALDFSGKQIEELLGQRDLTMNECARIFGAAIGKQNLSYMQAPAMMAKPAMMQSGMSADLADKLIEMCKAINDGIMAPTEPRNAVNTTPTSFETFTAEVLVPLYQGKPPAD